MYVKDRKNKPDHRSTPRRAHPPPLTVDNDALLAVLVASLRHLLPEAGVAGDGAAGADAVRLEGGGCRADGSDEAAGGLLV